MFIIHHYINHLKSCDTCNTVTPHGVCFFGVFSSMFPWIQRIQWQDIVAITVKGLEPVTSCIRDQDATTDPARHMWETGSSSWAQLILQWFIRFPEFSEFNESSVPFRKNSIVYFNFRQLLSSYTQCAIIKIITAQICHNLNGFLSPLKTVE